MIESMDERFFMIASARIRGSESIATAQPCQADPRMCMRSPSAHRGPDPHKRDADHLCHGNERARKVAILVQISRRERPEPRPAAMCNETSALLRCHGTSAHCFTCGGAPTLQRHQHPFPPSPIQCQHRSSPREHEPEHSEYQGSELSSFPKMSAAHGKRTIRLNTLSEPISKKHVEHFLKGED
jgi:hypothetical protein